MSSKALREHDPAELMPFFERYAEKQFDAKAKELPATAQMDGQDT
ncbi:MAG: hypothetical protein ABSH49_14410 [Bryobacteraceae bacterium]|jgi:hypothetical protein